MTLRSFPPRISPLHDFVAGLLPAAITAVAIAYALMVTFSTGAVSFDPEFSREATSEFVALRPSVHLGTADPATSGSAGSLTVYIVGSAGEAQRLSEIVAFFQPPGEMFQLIMANSPEDAHAITAALLTTNTLRRNDSSPLHVVILDALAELHTS